MHVETKLVPRAVLAAIAAVLLVRSAATAGEATGRTTPFRFATPVGATATPEMTLVQRRHWYRSDRDRLKALEEYYDDLEDHYDDINPALADHYERLENYYEDLRKGKHVYAPPQPYYGHAPHVHVYRPPAHGYIVENPGVPQLDGPILDYAQPHPNPPTSYQQSSVARTPEQELAVAYRDLCRQLARLTTGQRWERYLRLPTDNNRIVVSDTLSEALGRYDRVAGDDHYRVVTRLDGFQRTHAVLQQLVSGVERHPTPPEPTPAQPSSVTGEALPQPEEVPLPVR